MKKLIIFILSALMILSLVACGQTTKPDDKLTPDEPIKNVWIPNTSFKDVYIPEEANEALTNALDNYDGMYLLPIAYLGSQVVSGMNYMFLCQSDDNEFYAAIIYKDASGISEIANTINLKLDEVKDMSFTKADTEAVGGWKVTDDYKAVSLPKNAQNLFDSVMGTDDALYAPLAYLGELTTEGNDAYKAYLCHTIADEAMPEEEVFVMYLKHASDGQDTLDSITNLNLAELAELMAK